MRTARVSAALMGLVLVGAACGAGDESGSNTPATGADAAIEAPPATDAAPPADATSTEPADPAGADEPAENGADPDAEATDQVVPAALQFTAPLVGGGELDAAALAGKPTVFWFWAPT